MWARVVYGRLVTCVLQPVYERRPSTSCYTTLALYKDDMTITATSCKPVLLIDYLETY
jgi:hypothetical protein